MPKWWLVIGSPKNWQTSFDNGNLWGLKESQRGLWEHMDEGDFVLMYAAYPVSGVVGIGSIQSKFLQDIPLWPEEINTNQVIWPLRFELSVIFCLPQHLWRQERVVTASIANRAKRRQMLQIIEEDIALETLRSLPGEAQTLAEPQQMEPIPTNLHDQAISHILEIGRLQNYIAQKEYDIEIGRVDAVWRRVARSVPTFVFEVHVGGSLDRDLAKLKHAFEIWNSRIFLISVPNEQGRVQGLLQGAFHELKDRLKFIDIASIADLSQRKRDVRALEEKLGIL